LAVAGGWVEKRETTSFNLYRAPRIIPGDSRKATQWLDHVHRIYSEDAKHIIRWLAHHRQQPRDKINHALVLGGAQGIGKDSLLEPVKHAIGPWNFHEITPGHLLGQFNGYARSVILRINEGHDLGNIDRFKFYDHTKIYTATPPDVLRVNENTSRNITPSTASASSSRPTIRPTAFTYRPMIVATMLPGRTTRRRTSPIITGTSCGTSMPTAASDTSPPI
jgi:hypothetical protein